MLIEDNSPEMSINKVSNEIDKTIKNVIKPEYGCYTISLENKQVVLLCNFEAENFSDAETKMMTLTEAITKNIKQSNDISITSSISNLCCEPQNIPKCYKESLIAMDYRLIKGKNSIIRYNEDFKLATSQDYYHPVDTESYIINLVSLGDIVKVNSIMDEIYNKNFIEKKLSTFVVRCLMYDMINTTIRCLHEVNFEGKVSFGNSIDPIEQLSRCETLEELYEKIKNILATLCKSVESNKKSHNIALKDGIVQYLKNNYSDHNLCLSMIAEKFDLAPAYISRFFKEQTGVCFSDYLNKIRMDKAAELLKDNQTLSICSIADNVGYSNANTLIRCFKKYKGITPGKYKDNQENLM